MVAILGLFVVLFSVEIFAPLEIYKNKSPGSLLHTIKMGRFRNIVPATSEFLESDCRKYFYGLADNDFVHLEKVADSRPKEIKPQWVEARTRTYCMVFLVIMIVAVCFFSIRPLYSLFKKQNVCIDKVNKLAVQQGPYVPYLPQAWKWEFPISLRTLIVTHWILGGIFNFAVALLCIDGLGYLFVSHAIFFDKTANLWSWIFTSGKVLFGAVFGHIAGGIFVIVVSLPLLFLLMTYLRRFTLMLYLLLRVLRTFLNRRHITNNKLIFIKDYAQQICLKHHLDTPIIVLIPKRNFALNIHWLPVIKRPIIELTQGSIELLEIEELKAAIAHELGHIRQGLWKISTLKLLSSLALFPNYYLTLCVDWARKEIEADRFALDVTKDAQSLKQALIKISTAQLSYSISPKKDNTCYRKKILLKFAEKFNSILVSVKFFFGDGLFGYTHPYLSERLRAIDANDI